MITDPFLIKFLSGELDSEGQKQVQEWLDESPSNQEYFKTLKSIYSDEEKSLNDSELSLEWEKLDGKMQDSISTGTPTNARLTSWIVRVAAVLILAIGTTLIINLQKNSYSIKGTSDVPVAALLPDGSEVYLTKGSRLSYTKDFNNELREVSISGEAFFTVSSNPNKPFIVRTGEAKIKVTGTSFNVSAPVKNDDIEVTVKSGKVLFYNSETFSENSFKVGLGPGDKGIYSQKLKQLNKSHNAQYKDLFIN